MDSRKNWLVYPDKMPYGHWWGWGHWRGGVVLVGEGEGEGRFDKFVCMESFSGKDSF